MQDKEINQYDEQKQRHGYWESHYTNSKLAYKGYFVNGERRGCWSFYNNNVRNDSYLRKYYAK